ncbi:unnamed protein product [Danaus chrysippus]|uniref:(African queen) hypothetical protein n=1 Tax=Danaus chrysippus TaxID=151541 RepID=A0A8J2R4N3_9NEOP|nr:unnamed protein product [Danaus chrysippus]
MNISFEGKRILVTGTGQGIGRDIAIELCKAGAKVVAVSKTKSYLDSLHAQYPAIDVVTQDIGDWDKTRKVIDDLGYFDALVNNAAIATIQPFLECSPEVFDRMISVNLKAVINISQVVAKKMIEKKKPGVIINISTQGSKVAIKNHTIYSASKAALDSVTRTMALELGPYGIRVNAVNPTVIMTEMGKKAWSDPVKAKAMLSRIPLGRFGEVSEVTDVVLYLLSDRASMIHGVELPIDGGFLAV